jgi:hypothetical protein
MQLTGIKMCRACTCNRFKRTERLTSTSWKRGLPNSNVSSVFISSLIPFIIGRCLPCCSFTLSHTPATKYESIRFCYNPIKSGSHLIIKQIRNYALGSKMTTWEFGLVVRFSCGLTTSHFVRSLLSKLPNGPQ